MKTLLLACAVSVLGMASLRADLTVVQRIEFGDDSHTESTSEFKAGKTRVDAFHGTSLIMDLKSGEIISFNQNTKTYFKEAFNMATPPATGGTSLPQTGPSDVKPALIATGRKDMISGFLADEYTCTIAGVKTALWLTKALPDYQKVVEEMKNSSQGPLGTRTLTDGLDIADLPGFPLRVAIEPQPGQTGSTLTVVSVTTKPIADSEFEIPAGYNKLASPVLTPPAAMDSSPLPSPPR